MGTNNVVNLNIGKGQGITQAIVSKMNLSDVQRKKLNQNPSIWTNVMSELNKSNSIKYANNSKTGNISDAKNYVVNQGDQQISEATWNKITSLITKELKDNGLIVTGASVTGSVGNNVSPELPTKINPPKGLDKEPKAEDIPGYKKTISRSVNGEKQKIAVLKLKQDNNQGGKQDDMEVRFALKEDGTLGEKLVEIETGFLSKNRYLTESVYNKRVKDCTGMEPKELSIYGIEASFVENNNGDASLVFKKNGKKMTDNELRSDLKANKDLQASTAALNTGVPGIKFEVPSHIEPPKWIPSSPIS